MGYDYCCYCRCFTAALLLLLLLLLCCCYYCSYVQLLCCSAVASPYLTPLADCCASGSLGRA